MIFQQKYQSDLIDRTLDLEQINLQKTIRMRQGSARRPSLLKQIGLLLNNRTYQPTLHHQQPRISFTPTDSVPSRKRLYSTGKLNTIDSIKFQKLTSCNSPKTSNKWKYNGFPDVTKLFRKNSAEYITKNNLDTEEGRVIASKYFKMRLRKRQVMKLKRDVCQARETVRLIKLIEDAHENKINHFFDSFEQYMNHKQ